MSVRKKGLSLLAIAVVAVGAGVYWPARLEEAFPGWIDRTSYLRAVMPGASANLPVKKTQVALSGADAALAAAAARPPAPGHRRRTPHGAAPARAPQSARETNT